MYTRKLLLPEQSLVIFHPLTNLDLERYRKKIRGNQCLFIFLEIYCTNISLSPSYIL